MAKGSKANASGNSNKSSGFKAAPPASASDKPMKWIKQPGNYQWKDPASGKIFKSDRDPNTSGGPRWRGKPTADYSIMSPDPSAVPPPAALPPDPTNKVYTPEEVAASQSKYNIETAQQQADINRINEAGPYSSSTYTKGADGSVTRTIGLSEAEQSKLDWQNQAETKANSLIDRQFEQVNKNFSQPLSFDDLGPAPMAGGYESDRQRVEKDYSDRYLRQMQPEWQRQEKEFVETMAGRGIPEGSELFNRQLGEFKKQQNQSMLDINSQAIQAGGAEQSRLFEQGNTARGNAIGERMAVRGNPFNEMSQLLGTRQGVQNPQFAPTPEVQVQPTDYTGAYSTFQSTQQRRQEQEQQAQQFGQQQKFESEQSALNRQVQREAIRKSGGGGGGGGGGPSWAERAAYELDAKKQLMAQEHQYNLETIGAGKPGKPSKGSGFGAAAGSAAGSFANAAGSAAGSSLFGSKAPGTPTLLSANKRQGNY